VRRQDERHAVAVHIGDKAAYRVFRYQIHADCGLVLENDARRVQHGHYELTLRPEEGKSTPVSILIVVDLPAL